MRRHRQRRDTDAAEVQIPIPAMLDMTFQLLSFFILTFNPPHAGEGQMDMTLPAVGAAKAKDEQADPFALSSAEVEVPTDITLEIKSLNGDISQIKVLIREKESTVANAKELRGFLQQVEPDIGKATIKLRPERELKYARLIEIMDACLAAKFQSVGFMPPPDSGTSK